jgi:hypothetical protein
MQRRLILILLLIAGVVVLVLAMRHGPVGSRRGLGEARSLEKRVVPALSADPRFGRVQLRAQGDTLTVEGEVADQEALISLQKLIVAPPDANFSVSWRVKVIPPNP